MSAPNHSRLILALETSNPAASADPLLPAAGVAIARIASHPTLSPHAVHILADLALPPAFPPDSHRAARRSSASPCDDDTLFPTLDRAFAAAAVSPADLDLIAVSAGPGGYTAVRVACAVAKLLTRAAQAQQLARPPAHRCQCFQVPSFLVPAIDFSQAATPPAAASNSNLAVALAAKSDSVWISPILPSTLASLTDLEPFARAPGRIISASDLPALADLRVSALLADHFLPLPIRDAALALGFSIHPPRFSPRALIDSALRLTPSSIAALNPIYPREPDAVTLWRKRNSTDNPPVS